LSTGIGKFHNKSEECVWTQILAPGSPNEKIISQENQKLTAFPRDEPNRNRHSNANTVLQQPKRSSKTPEAIS
jgi:hypothetical protein